MKKYLLLSLAMTLALSAGANIQKQETQLKQRASAVTSQRPKPIQPTYLEGVYKDDGWRSNWFVGAGVGGSVFYGSPLGCEDAFGRMKPLVRLEVGKWFTPTIATRLSFDGWRFKAANLVSHSFQSYHADLMWNALREFWPSQTSTRFDIVPYVGVGFLHNAHLSTNPFAFSYGVQGRYRLTDRAAVTLELGGTTTFKDFDGIGSSRSLGDNLVNLTAGFTWTFGTVGWKRVIDPRPYQTQHDQLWAWACSLQDQNKKLVSAHSADVRVIGELKKILRIEGLLQRYGGDIAAMEADSLGFGTGFPRNDYSGLNSLMARLRGYGYDDADLSALGFANGEVRDWKYDHTDQTAAQTNGAEETDDWGRYLADLSTGDACIGVPVYFFFRIGTATLTDESQLINLDEVARLAQEYNLVVRVVGAADAATGSVAQNMNLSGARARFICDHLTSLGVTDEQIEEAHHGGISTHSPAEANRHTRIELYRP